MKPFCAFALTFAAAAFVLPCPAMVIRGYTAARHNRFTNFPSAPALNPTAWFPAANYSGVGWRASDGQPQFALVSPQHFVWATHYGISPGTQIRFRSPSGAIVTATVDSITQIMDGLVGTDLSLGRFTAPIPEESGIVPFPYLNLPSENDYRKTTLQVFGFQTRVARGILSGFSTQAISGSTRMHHFLYRNSGDNLGGDDGYFVVGDSGSPSFATINGSPALVGIHSAVGSSGGDVTNFDTTLRSYITQLDALMASDGYAMIPAVSNPVILTDTAAVSPDPLRWMEPGTATFTLQNPAANPAANVVVKLRFSPANQPDTITSPGWTVIASGPQWEFHRAALAPSATTTFTAQWASVPAVSSLWVEMEYESDGAPHRTAPYDLEPAPSYTEWSSILAEPSVSADPDDDGRVNLEEYAFGSDPMSGERITSAGATLGLTMEAAGGIATAKFPVRTDSELRGLTYQLEFSDDLENWAQPPPSGLAISYVGFIPARPGYKEAVVTFPSTATKQFMRVRIVLDESLPGMPIP